MVNKQPLSVLVIDDDAGVATTAEWSLRHFGCTVSVTLQANQGVALAQSIQPDIILCDAAMPNLGGAQLIALLKSDPATAHIPIVLMTGHSDAQRFAGVPYNAFVEKPFSPAKLFELLQRVAAGRTSAKVEEICKLGS
jgi:CheY-like chemotaxis protein